MPKQRRRVRLMDWIERTTMADAPVLDVALYGRRIGSLTLLPGDQTLFVFDQVLYR